jgi:phosphatidylglycerol:prolipoprotein diacylglycerol transferase
MIAVGFLLFLFLTYRHPRRQKLIGNELYLNTVFLGLISGIVGGRLLYVLTAPREFAGRWLEVFFPWIGGLIVLGSILGILITVPLYLRRHNVAVLPFFDVMAVYAPLLQAIARIGCFCAGCCYGLPATVHWAVTFTNQHSIAPTNIPLHPTQLYISAMSLVMFLIMLVLERKCSQRPGLLLSIYLLLENASRFTIDFWRGDSSSISIPLFNHYMVLSDMQWLSLLSFVFSVGLLILVLRCRNVS